MANKFKPYHVMKDGAELAAYKQLSSAMKKALAENAIVYREDELIYPSNVENEEYSQASPSDIMKTPKSFRLSALMNVRTAPSLSSPILRTENAGTIVVAILEGEWLRLSDGSYILYQDGMYAERC